MGNKTYKSIIQKYVVLKINSGNWKANDAIPSEHNLANKFGCSRLTAREALQQLVYSGVLKVHQGRGYIIPENNEMSLRSFALSHCIINTKVTKMLDATWLRNYFNLDPKANILAIIKEYFDVDGALAIQFTILNNDFLWEKDLSAINDSITKYLASQGVAIKNSEIIIKTVSHKMPEDIYDAAKTVGWQTNAYPIEEIVSHSTEDWIERTVRITKPSAFKVTFNKRNFL